jgi:hypothetical protein
MYDVLLLQNPEIDLETKKQITYFRQLHIFDCNMYEHKSRRKQSRNVLGNLIR